MSDKELAIVIPVYNEEGAIGNVLDKWHNELKRLNIDFEIHTYNDGSKDNTLKILNDYAKNKSEIIVHDKKNSGHGPTILKGYRENSDANWVFQIDSDDEMGPEAFEDLWKKRNDYDFIIGRRDGRKSPLSRKIVSFISRSVVWLFYGSGVWDVNSPYRLMRGEKFKDIFNKIPEDTFAPNVIISGMVCLRKYKILELPVSHRDRTTGEVSIKKWKLFKAAFRSFLQTISFRFSV